MADTTYDVTVTDGEQSTKKIEGEIPFSELEEHRSTSIKELGKDVSIDGFRKGNIPEDILVKHVGEMAVLHNMAERALSKAYPAIIREHDIEAIGRPDISITKIAEGNPLGFSATVAVIPEITLPDYKKIAKEQNEKKESDEVTNPEIDEAIERIQRQKLAYDRIQEKAKKAEESKGEADGELTLPTPETEDKKDDEEEVDYSKEPLPELTDEYVKTLGNFESVDDFKKQITEHLKSEKEQEVMSKHRATLTDAIVEETKMNIPQILIDSEIGQMLAQMEDDLRRAGLEMDGYLEHIKKTKEEMIADWKPVAEKRAKVQLILNEIAKVENIEPDKEKVDHQLKHLLEQYKEADEGQVRVYVESMFRNDKVMEMLESE